MWDKNNIVIYTHRRAIGRRKKVESRDEWRVFLKTSSIIVFDPISHIYSHQQSQSLSESRTSNFLIRVVSETDTVVRMEKGCEIVAVINLQDMNVFENLTKYKSFQQSSIQWPVQRKYNRLLFEFHCSTCSRGVCKTMSSMLNFNASPQHNLRSSESEKCAVHSSIRSRLIFVLLSWFELNQ